MILPCSGGPGSRRAADLAAGSMMVSRPAEAVAVLSALALAARAQPGVVTYLRQNITSTIRFRCNTRIWLKALAQGAISGTSCGPGCRSAGMLVEKLSR